MRIGIAAAETPRWPKMDWVEQAARNLGYEVRRATGWETLPPLLADCDLVIAGQKSLAGRWPNIRKAVENRCCPLVYWWFDLVATQPGVRIENQPLFDIHRRMFVASDVTFVKERGLLDQYRLAGVNAHYLDQGCPADLPEVRPQRRQWDLLVYGQSGGAYRERSRNVRAVAEAGYRVGWAEGTPGFGHVEQLPWMPPGELPRLASRAECVLSCGARNDLDGYWSDSFWLALGMGACVLRRSTPGLPDGPFLIYHTDEELRDAVGWVRKNPAAARDMGSKARQWVLEQHTDRKSVV